MEFPTYEAHNMSTERNRKPFLDAYLEAKGYRESDRSAGYLAFLAFNLVNAKFRLSDISIFPQSQLAISAQELEILGWQAKISRFIENKHHLHSVLGVFQADFTEMATASRIPDQEDREFTALAMAGRIDEIPPKNTEPFVYAWQRTGMGNEFDSSFNRGVK